MVSCGYRIKFMLRWNLTRIVFTSPEIAVSKNFSDNVLRHESYQSRLCILAIDELHLVDEMERLPIGVRISWCSSHATASWNNDNRCLRNGASAIQLIVLIYILYRV